MTANSKFTENSVIDVINVVDYRILYTVSYEFNGDYKRFRKNISKNKYLESLKIKGINTYIDSIYKVKEDKGYSLQEDYKYLSEIFIYRNRVLASRLAEEWILIVLPPFPLKTIEAYASLFILISESIVTIAMLIRPPKENGLKISNVDEMIKTICYLQKPQDLEIDKKAIFVRLKHRELENFLDNLLDNKDVYSLSEIFFIAYYFLFDLLGKSKNNSKNEHSKSYKNYNEFLNIFNTTLFTTSILFIPPPMFSDTTFIEKIPNLIYSYNKTAKKGRDFVNDISISNDSKFFMTYNRFLMVFKEGKDLEEEKDHWVSRAFVINEVISGIFYSLHYFANEYARLDKKKFLWSQTKKQKQLFLNRVMEYSSSFFDPNFSQPIWRLLDESFKINEFTVVLKTIKDNIIMSETVKLNRRILSITFVLAILTFVLIFIAIVEQVFH
ncbi:MAG: hypothetical protein M1576_01985 [Deltaproteobacteria bacterium]|nr:hypothetical protein [Deltaproteobacteria bacterium]